MKSQNRQLERVFRKASLNIHKDIYLAQLTLYKDSISHAKSQYYSGLICSNAGNTKILFSVYNRIIQPPDSLLLHMYSSDTCESLLQFFNDKINKVHQHLGSTSSPLPSSELLPPYQPFSTFEFPHPSVISDLIRKSKLSFSQLDPLPTPLVKSCLPSAPLHLSHYLLLTVHWNCSHPFQNRSCQSHPEKTWFRPQRFQ